MSDAEIVIAGYAETPLRTRSGRSAYQLAGEALAMLLDGAGLDPAAIDGLSVSNALSESGNAFYPLFMAEALGLSPTWLTAGGIGGCSALGGLARAATAIREGQCSIAVVLSADASASSGGSAPTAFRGEFQRPIGITGPTAAFGLLMRRYAAEFPFDERALGRIAVTQRDHALANPNAVDKLRKPLSMDDYLASRMIADPLRILDCVMFCDGANAFLVTSRGEARRRGWDRLVRPIAYREITNHLPREPAPDILANGFERIAPELWRATGLGPADIDHFQPYDDFTIAVLMQIEAFGFCARGDGSAYVLDTDLSHRGALPLNTGGGQISAGQPGLAGGGLQLVEAVRQMRGEGGARQVADPRRALVTGIGGVLYGRNWSASAAMILEADDA